MRELALAAISANTRSSYESAVRSYLAFAQQRRWPPQRGTTAARVSEWLAHIALHTALTANTISSYKSGLRRWHTEQTDFSDEPNPCDSTLARNVMKGIALRRAPAETEARRQKPELPVIGPPELREMRPYLDPPGASVTQLMLWSAACTAAHALLRPNEIIGIRQHGEPARFRALRPSHVRFYVDMTGPRTVTPRIGAPPPARYTIALGPTKADPLGANEPILVWAPMAVSALWRWFLTRDLYRLPDTTLFHDGTAPLSIKSLTSAMEVARVAAGHPYARVTGKAFRRGGASHLVHAGVERSAIQKQGRWRSDQMPLVYASAASRSHRHNLANAQLASPL